MHDRHAGMYLFVRVERDDVRASGASDQDEGDGEHRDTQGHHRERCDRKNLGAQDARLRGQE